MLQDVAVEVEMTEKKPPRRDRQLEDSSPQQPESPSTVVVLLVAMAVAAGVGLYAYHITLRIHRLEQRVETTALDHAGCGPTAATPRSVQEQVGVSSFV